MAKKEKVTLELKLRVTYIPNGTSEEELKAGLTDFVLHGLDKGLLSGDTKAEIEVLSSYPLRLHVSYDITTIPQPVKEKKPKGRFHEGSTQVCAHRVTFFYRLPARIRISKDELFMMTEHAEERAQEMITQGYVQGELNYETEKFQATGWWRIDNG